MNRSLRSHPSDREVMILRLALRGLALPAIALRLGVSPDLVAGHLAKLQGRLGNDFELTRMLTTTK
jgi:DNA-binding CsgD family transcriptional regulator